MNSPASIFEERFTDVAPFGSGGDRSPAHLVFGESLRELYWSGHHLIRVLLQLENVATNGQLRRKIHEYARVCQSRVYSVEHIFELVDEVPRGSTCSITESISRNVLKAMADSGQAEGGDKKIRNALAEFFAHELTAMQFLMKLALSMERMDVARIVGEMQRRTRLAFSLAFQPLAINGVAA